MRGLGSWFMKLIGPTLLVALLATTNLTALTNSLSRVEVLWWIIALGVWLIIACLKGLRWRLMCRDQGIKLGAGRACHWYVAGLFLGGVSPGRVGELIKVSYLRNLGHATGKALFSTVMDRVWDILVMPAMALMAVLSMGVGVSGPAQVSALMLGPILATILLLGRGRRLLLLPLRRLVPKTYREQATVTLDDFLGEFETITLSQSLWAGGITVLSWLLYVAAAQALCLGLGLDVALEVTAAAVLGAALVGLLPITISGVGTRDAVFVFFFQGVGLAVHDAIALATLMLGLNIAVLLLYWPFYHLAARPLRTELS